MPIVDGLASTKMIRAFEKSHSGLRLSARASGNGRVPIFAVSASLLERERQTYIDAGFDGWILKPVDFKRLNILLAGIVEDDTRKSTEYKPGEWEIGGWLQRRRSSTFILSEQVSPHIITATGSADLKSEDGSMHSSKNSSEGTVTPGIGYGKEFIFDERLGPPKEQKSHVEEGRSQSLE